MRSDDDFIYASVDMGYTNYDYGLPIDFHGFQMDAPNRLPIGSMIPDWYGAPAIASTMRD